uniref:Uncharacterized protein n=1 Tax=Timema tahoe TaxID=61484 RepID=A0A7R9FPB7_9NEOP|nr:unnamed protein product [Timema tahoe]
MLPLDREEHRSHFTMLPLDREVRELDGSELCSFLSSGSSVNGSSVKCKLCSSLSSGSSVKCKRCSSLSSGSSVKCKLCSSLSSGSSVKCKLCSSLSSGSSVKCKRCSSLSSGSSIGVFVVGAQVKHHANRQSQVRVRPPAMYRIVSYCDSESAHRSGAGSSQNVHCGSETSEVSSGPVVLTGVPGFHLEVPSLIDDGLLDVNVAPREYPSHRAVPRKVSKQPVPILLQDLHRLPHGQLQPVGATLAEVVYGWKEREMSP